MGNCIYSKKHFKIYKLQNDFIIHNTHKGFENGHTHVNNYNLAKILIVCALTGKIPDKSKRLLKNKRIMESLIRICDRDYIIEKINNEIDK